MHGVESRFDTWIRSKPGVQFQYNYPFNAFTIIFNRIDYLVILFYLVLHTTVGGAC